MILAGDIGRTLSIEIFPSAEHAGLEEIAAVFVEKHSLSPYSRRGDNKRQDRSAGRGASRFVRFLGSTIVP